MSGLGLPLHGLFQALREAGLPLGVSDYLDLLAALRMGEGADRPALLRLCRMLWTSSVEEGLLLERLFAEVLGPPLREADVPVELTEGPSSADIAPAASGGDAAAAGALKPPVIVEPEPPRDAPVSLRSVEIAARVTQGSTAKLDLAMTPRRLAVGEYLPVTARQLGQSWRRLRRMEARGPRTELDFAATVAGIARTGVWGRPALAARRINVAALLLLVDRDGSMAPFHPFTRHIVESAVHGSNLGRTDVGYFHNYAIETIDHGDTSVALGELLAKLPAFTGALIVSDAGAARGRYSTERVDGTHRMLARLRAKLRRAAWINPVPRSRWIGTSAQDIAGMVPMFEANRAGFDAALRVLRGRRAVPHGASPWGKP
jgi:uncharacterized protein